jgi:predicted permease
VTSPAQTLARAWRKLRRVAGRDAAARELDEEMRFHRDLLARDFEANGLTPSDARDAAKRQFGNSLVLRERSADAWSVPRLDDIAQDVRFGARMLRRSPAFALIAIVAIGLAIGINSGFFTLVDAFVWRPIPVARPDGLVKLALTYARGGGSIIMSYPQVQALARNSRTLTDVMPYGRCAAVAFRSSTSATAKAATPACISGNYFASLGGRAAAGRPLVPADDRDDAPPAVVISDGFWAREFSRAPDAIGRDVVVNGTHATVVGVMSPDFVGMIPLVPDFWMTIPIASRLGAAPGSLLDPTNRFIDVKARLRPGVTLAQAEAEISGILAEPRAPSGPRAEGARISGAVLTPNDSMLPLNWQTMLIVAPALLVVALVLVIACANLANLLLSRALARQREIAVRLALGASRGRLLRQLLTESLLIAVTGAALGLVLARWTVLVVSRSYVANIPAAFGTIALNLDVSWRVVAYTIALAGVSVLAFGLAPALQATSPNVMASLKGEDTLLGTQMRRSRFRDYLVATQVAGCLVLLVAAGTLIASMRSLGTNTTRLDTGRVTVAKLGLTAIGRVPPALDSARRAFSARVSTIPSVSATARALHPPYESWWPLLSVATPGDAGYLHVQYTAVTPRYFEVVGQRLASGRAFTADDTVGDARVAIVTAATAHILWPAAPAVGQTLRVAQRADEPDRLYRVVGVANDAHSGMPWDDDAAGFVFLPATARDFANDEMPLLVRSEAAEPELARSISDIAGQVDPSSPVHVEPALAARDMMLVPIRYGSWITSAVGAFGLGLALIGLYGVVAFAVAQRRRDIAIHVAMGALPGDVLRLVLRRELRLVVAGLCIGLVLALGESKLIEAWLLPLTPLGAAGFIGLAALLFGVAAVASVVPAIGALRIAPMNVLRQE